MFDLAWSIMLIEQISRAKLCYFLHKYMNMTKYIYWRNTLKRYY